MQLVSEEAARETRRLYRARDSTGQYGAFVMAEQG